MKKQSTTRSAALKAVALALLLPGFFCSAGRAQTMETITNSILAFEGLLANVSPTQEVVYVGDMGFPQSSLRAWTWQLRRMAGLPTGPVPNAMFDLNYAAWTDGVMPYTYAPNMPQATINTFEAAMREWQKAANLKFIPRTIEAINYIYVQTNTGGNSFVGMRGGAQVINIDASASMVECAHELGHALGMEHEQCRTDRDTYVKMRWENFLPSLGDPRTNVNFAIVYNSTNFGPYDYASIQEYPNHDGNTARTNGCSDPQCTQIEPLDPYYTAAGRPYMYYGATNLSALDKVGMAGRYGLPRTISGQVRNGLNGPFAGVTVTISGGVSYRGPASVTTDANGNYSFIGIPNNSGTFVVSATLGGHSFVPPSWNVNMGTTDSTTANFRDADTSPPTVTINSPANTSYKVAPLASGTAADNNGIADTGVAQVRVVLYRTSDAVWWNFHDDTWGTTAFNAFYNIKIATGTTSWSASLPASLADGGYQVQAQAVDAAANASGWVTRNFTIDNTAPIIAFSPLTDQQVVFNFDQLGGTVSKTSTVQFTIEWFQAAGNMFWNGVNWTSVATDPGVLLPANLSGLNWTPAPGTLPSRLQLAQANYLIQAYATDTAGNGGQNSLVLTRSPHDTTPPIVNLDSTSIHPGDVLTNHFLPPVFGLAYDPESGVASVNVLLARNTGSGLLYWDGANWTATPVNLATYTAQNISWQLNVALPSGANLPNAAYALVVSAVNNEVPVGGAASVTFNFSVDYHPLYYWTAASYTNNNPNPPPANNRWDNPLNWYPYGVPFGDVIAVIGSGAPASPDNTAMGSVSIHGVNMSGDSLRTSGMLITNLNVSGGVLSGGVINIPANGVFNWSGGVLAGSFNVPAGASLNLIGDNDKTLGTHSEGSGDLTSAGPVTWTGAGHLNIGGGGSAWINGGIFTVQTDAQVLNTSDGGGGPVFVNNGTFVTASGYSTAFTNSPSGTVAFNNNGTLSVQGGVILLDGGGGWQQWHFYDGGRFAD